LCKRFSYHKDFQSYYKLKNAGCLFQLDLLSLTQHYGKDVQQTAQKLLKENLFDFVGTDTHHSEHLNLLETISTPKNLKIIENLLHNNKRFLKE
jgi:protein-tyrosine phosphatase